VTTPVADKQQILLLSTVIADAIVVTGFVVAMVFAIRMLNAKARSAPVPPPDPARALLYLGAVVFWPLAVGLGMANLGKPETVRTARVLLLITIGHLSFAVIVAVAIVTAVAIDPPRVVLDLLP
jgi:hypothetical protein